MKTMATATPVDHDPNAPSPPDSVTADTSEPSVTERDLDQSVESSTEEAASAQEAWDQPMAELAVDPDDLPPEKPLPRRTAFKTSLLPLLVAASGLGVIVFCSTLYILTRPCVLGKCPVIPNAQQIAQKSTKTLQKPESGKAILDAQAQLQVAIHSLEQIPPWSRHHTQAQTLIQTYQSQAQTVDEIVTALQTAARAGYKSQNPPYSPSEWIAIQQLWREAITQLEQLPADSQFHAVAQAKIKAYKTNLAAINQRLLKERQAQADLEAAKQAAQMAEARQGIAQSLTDWQLAYATWQTSMNRLDRIPQGTTPYKEAQQLLVLYLPKMAKARDRKTQEQIAANAYNQGIRLAQLATDAQGNNQWSVALVHWRNALTYAKQVPSNTYYYGKAQALVKPYQTAFKQAQDQLQVAVKIQQARSDLNQTCSGTIQVCSYTIDKSVIKVRLTPAYIQTIRERAAAAQAKGQSEIHAGIVNHILTLEKALKVISNNAAIPFELYSADGVLIETHNPIN